MLFESERVLGAWAALDDVGDYFHPELPTRLTPLREALDAYRSACEEA